MDSALIGIGVLAFIWAIVWLVINLFKKKPKKKSLLLLVASIVSMGWGSAITPQSKQASNVSQEKVSKHSSSAKDDKKESSTKPKTKAESKPKETKKVAKSKPKKATEPSKSTIDSNKKTILTKLISYTDSKSAGPTKDYYWVNGKSKLTGFKNMKAGDYHFSSDSQGRSSTAKAVLTYSEYKSSKGSRQGEPLDPPSWPSSNPKVAISYVLTGRTYHGYLYNRSHSIGDSLLGEKSYTSEYNFTTGTRPQNVGADQNGGMRYAEEAAEDYWDSHTNTSNTINYETTPVYKGNETVPRGSIVDMKSSDGKLNTEVVVLNSVEGIDINYSNGANNAKPIVKAKKKVHHKASTAVKNYTPVKSYSSNSNDDSSSNSDNSDTSNNNGYTNDGSWSVAESGMVFVSKSQRYYSRVKNPDNYEYISESSALSNGAKQAARGNEYARP